MAQTVRSFRATERIYRDGAMEDGRIIVVRARTYQEAAQHAVNRLVSRRARAHRCTGDPGMGGIFQGYRQWRRGEGESSYGPNIHIREI